MRSAQGLPEPGQAWIEPARAQALDLRPGDALMMGELQLQVSALIDTEPDRGAGFMNFAPRLFVGMSDVQRSGLIQPASRVTWRYALVGSPERVRAYTRRAQGVLERHEVRGVGDDLRAVEHHVARVGGLAHLAVDLGDQAQLRHVLHFVGGDDAGPHRAIAVEALAEEPLAVLVLQRARGGVVDHGVAVDVVVGVLLRDAAAAGPDDDTEFAFVVGRVAVIEVTEDRLAGPDHRVRPFGEGNRQFRNRVLAGAGINTAVMEFVSVIVIVLASGTARAATSLIPIAFP